MGTLAPPCVHPSPLPRDAERIFLTALLGGRRQLQAGDPPLVVLQLRGDEPRDGPLPQQREGGGLQGVPTRAAEGACRRHVPPLSGPSSRLVSVPARTDILIRSTPTSTTPTRRSRSRCGSRATSPAPRTSGSATRILGTRIASGFALFGDGRRHSSTARAGCCGWNDVWIPIPSFPIYYPPTSARARPDARDRSRTQRAAGDAPSNALSPSA